MLDAASEEAAGDKDVEAEEGDDAAADDKAPEKKAALQINMAGPF